MGYSSALGIAQTDTSLEQQVSWHFSSNCFPPVPQLMVPFAVEAIEHAISDDWDVELQCPEGVSFRGAEWVSVASIINSLHLDAFVDSAFYEEDDE